MQHFFQIKFHLITTNFMKGSKKDVARASPEAVWKFCHLLVRVTLGRKVCCLFAVSRSRKLFYMYYIEIFHQDRRAEFK